MGLVVLLLVLVVFAYISVDWPSLRKGKLNLSDEHDETQEKSNKIAPDRRYKQYEHSDEPEHRTAEQYNWRRQNALSLLVIIFSGSAAIFTAKTYLETKRQADISYESFVESNRPIIAINIYGIGSVPSFQIVNVGTKPAYIEMVQMRMDFDKKVLMTESRMNEECHSEMGLKLMKPGDIWEGTCNSKSSGGSNKNGQPYIYGFIEYKSVSNQLRWRKNFGFTYFTSAQVWSIDGYVGSNDEVRIDRNGSPIAPLADE